MEAALIGLLGALVSAYVNAHFQSRVARARQFSALAELFKAMAECLAGMRVDLGKDKIPTRHANRLKKALDGYEQTINSSPLRKKDKEQFLLLITQIEQCLVRGRAEDDIIRGKILRAPELKRDKLLVELDRLAGRLLGQHDVLKALAQ